MFNFGEESSEYIDLIEELYIILGSPTMEQISAVNKTKIPSKTKTDFLCKFLDSIINALHNYYNISCEAGCK